MEFETYEPFRCRTGDEVNIEGVLWIAAEFCYVIGHKGGEPVIHTSSGPVLNGEELILKSEHEEEQSIKDSILNQYVQVPPSELVGMVITHHLACYPGILLIGDRCTYVKLVPGDDYGCSVLETEKIDFQDLCDLNLVDEGTLQRIQEADHKKGSLSMDRAAERQLQQAITRLGQDRVQEILEG
jgi:hypothetical protein